MNTLSILLFIMGLRKIKALFLKRRGKVFLDYSLNITLETREYYNNKFEKIDKNYKFIFKYAESTEEFITRIKNI